MSEEENDKPAFGISSIRDIGQIPCARDALLHGAGGSLVAGLLFFLATSRVKRSCDMGVAGFILTTLGSWSYCRYENAMVRVQKRMIHEGIKNKMAYEGTSLDPTLKKPSDGGQPSSS